jgi:hypothetical protein
MNIPTMNETEHLQASRRPLSTITSDAVLLLMKNLGMSDTLRFLGQFSIGSGNYTEERRTIAEETTAEEIIRAAKERRHRKEQAI